MIALSDITFLSDKYLYPNIIGFSMSDNSKVYLGGCLVSQYHTCWSLLQPWFKFLQLFINIIGMIIIADIIIN